MGDTESTDLSKYFYRYLIAIQFISSFWFITIVGLSSKLNFDFDAKPKCFSRALKCHFLPQMHQETHNQFKDFGKNDHCMCQKQKCYSRALKCHFLPQLHVLKIKDNLLENQ